MKRLMYLLPLLALAGCVSTAYHVVTAPVRVASWTADKLTTSQAEADRNRGRKIRKQEAKERREAKKEARRQREEARNQTEPR